jgi:hypothetical protein
MTGWKARFERLVEELEFHPMLCVDESEIRPPASESEIERATSSAGGILPPGMADVYREMNGMRLAWSAREGINFDTKEAPSGAINLLPIIRERGESVFGSWKDVVWFSEDDEFRRVVPFDLYTPEAGSAFHPVPGEMRVHYHYLGETLSPTGRTFLEYLELLLKSRGYLYWPASLCESEQDSAVVEDFRVNFPQLFGENTELFRPKG